MGFAFIVTLVTFPVNAFRSNVGSCAFLAAQLPGADFQCRRKMILARRSRRVFLGIYHVMPVRVYYLGLKPARAAGVGQVVEVDVAVD